MTKDRLSKERRSWNMSLIRGKDTMPERRVRSLLHRLGYRFCLHVRMPVPFDSVSASTASSLSTFNHQPATLVARVRCRTPRAFSVDIVLSKHKTAIFVHGCFWHRHRGCKNSTTPAHRRAWWLKKLEGNAVRDRVHQHALRKLGWRNIVVWECKTEKPKTLEKLGRRLAKLLR